MSKLFEPLTLRSLTLKNRAVVSPMCQYSARHGYANDWHLVHLGRFALGGFGTVFVEATGVLPEGRITYGCLGLWEDSQVKPLRRIADFLHAQGAAAAIQLAHAGRKASTAIPWRGGFNETGEEKARLGFESWVPVAPSALPHNEKHQMPLALDLAGLDRVRSGFEAAARRALEAGFDIVELHAAHGYLLNEFLSPVANRRNDQYGGSQENRMRLPLEVVDTVRRVWPDSKPLFMRISAQDWIDGGWQIEDSIVFARELSRRGVDLIDCSSGGFDGAAVKPKPFYQAPFAAAVKRGAGIATMAIGLITDAAEAEALLARGDADLVALARGALDDPNWALHAGLAVGVNGDPYAWWPDQAVRVREMHAILKAVQ